MQGSDNPTISLPNKPHVSSGVVVEADAKYISTGLLVAHIYLQRLATWQYLGVLLQNYLAQHVQYPYGYSACFLCVQ